MTLAYIALGSNQASPLEQVARALNAIAAIPQSRVVATSSFYRTPPLGPAGSAGLSERRGGAGNRTVPRGAA